MEKQERDAFETWGGAVTHAIVKLKRAYTVLGAWNIALTICVILLIWR